MLAFKPPRDNFRARSELLKSKQEKRIVCSYIHYIRLFTSFITANPPNKQTLITLIMQGLADGPVRTYPLRLESDTLEEPIRVVEQEDFSVKQAHVSSDSYLPPRRQESGGPELMDLSYAKSGSSGVTNDKKLQRSNRCQKPGRYAY